ncbi:hypothetical protein I7331_10865, partial [Frankia sp. AgB1.8]|nr:hypothetical protein [Frankia sp. AgB1.8]
PGRRLALRGGDPDGHLGQPAEPVRRPGHWPRPAAPGGPRGGGAPPSDAYPSTGPRGGGQYPADRHPAAQPTAPRAYPAPVAPPAPPGAYGAGGPGAGQPGGQYPEQRPDARYPDPGQYPRHPGPAADRSLDPYANTQNPPTGWRDPNAARPGASDDRYPPAPGDQHRWEPEAYRQQDPYADPYAAAGPGGTAPGEPYADPYGQYDAGRRRPRPEE